MKSNVNPLVSIIIPTYNLSAYIAETLNSVQSQSFKNFEVLIIDDTSDDNTVEIVKTYQKQDQRFKLFINCHKKGVSGARNTGIDHAIGEWIAFLDGDDIWSNDSLLLRLTILKEYPDAQYIGGNYARFSQDITQAEKSNILLNPIWHEYFFNASNTGKCVCIEQPITHFLRSVFAQTGTILVKSVIVKELGGFEETLLSTEDHQLWLKIASHVKAFIFIPEIVMFYRQRENSLTHTTRSMYHDAPRAYQMLLNDSSFRLYHKELSKNICHFIKLNSFIYRNNKQYLQAIKWSFQLVCCAPFSKISWKNLIASCLLR
jgi:glycosyltransferase involved in cell wall biosynthesis